MNKKILMIFIAAIILVVTGLIIWSGLSQSPLKKGNDSSEAKDVDPPLLKEVLEFERLQRNRSDKSDERLAELALRQDAIGYYANIELAERYSGSEKDPVQYYRRALELYDTKDIRIILANRLAKQGNTLDAAKTYGSALYDKAVLDSLLQLKLEPEVTGQIMIDARQFQTAVDFLRGELDKQPNVDKKVRLYKLYGRALTELGKYNEALSTFEQVYTLGQSDSESKWWHARSFEATGQVNKAKEIYKSLGESGAYRLGLLLEKEGSSREAAAAYTLSSEPDSLWKGARIWDELGAHKNALDNYLKIAKAEGTYQDDAAYRAYVLINRNKALGAEKIQELVALLSKYPAWLYRINKEPSLDNLSEISYTRPEFIDRAAAYKSSGRMTMAQVEQSIGEKYASLQAKIALGDWYLEQGDYYQAVVWGLRALREQPNRRAYELAYQRPFSEEVQRASAEFNVDPFLIWAVMREESYYKKDAVSRVGALGLMQLMPDTAKEIASRLKVPFKQEELLSPATNIRFGTFYMRSMLNMFSGDVDKALASYNGGAGNVRRWTETKTGSTKEGFPTAVSFLETREYITKVSNSYYTYKWLYGKK